MNGAPPTAISAAAPPAAVEDGPRGGVPSALPLRPWTLPARDAALAACSLAIAVLLGSGGFVHLDPALLGYAGATFVALVAAVYRASAFWRRPAAAFYGRALAARARQGTRSLAALFGHAGRDLVAQGFVRRRSAVRWLAHLLLSLGTLVSFAITVPLVFGWLHFRAEGDAYRVVLWTIPTVRMAVGGAAAWLAFHALSLAGGAVALGAVVFLVLRVRARRLPGAVSGFAMGPLLLLLAVALTGLALPATRGAPELFRLAAVLHEGTVIVLLVALPFAKLRHVLIRPLQLGARAVRAADAPWASCACGAPLAPVGQKAAVASLLAERRRRFGAHADRCPRCRRRAVARAQAGLVEAHFQPRLPGAAAAPRREEGA